MCFRRCPNSDWALGTQRRGALASMILAMLGECSEHPFFGSHGILQVLVQSDERC